MNHQILSVVKKPLFFFLRKKNEGFFFWGKKINTTETYQPGGLHMSEKLPKNFGRECWSHVTNTSNLQSIGLVDQTAELRHASMMTSSAVLMKRALFLLAHLPYKYVTCRCFGERN